MDWIMPINDIFEQEVTKINSSLMPPGFNGDVRTVRAVQDSLAKLIDNLGEQSASAQGLNKVITSADKLRASPTHILYLLKDERAKEGKGDIIGMLKVGRKHLFLFDEHDQVHEVEPMCVLDFYILRDRQRMGYGRRLFDFMLADLELMAWELAIDGPSDKMEKFLTRNFCIDTLMRQNNNFAVAPGFFERTDDEISNKKLGSCAPAVAAAVGRFAAPKPASAIANVIHGAYNEEPSRRSPSPGMAGHWYGEDASEGEEEVWREVTDRDYEDDYEEQDELFHLPEEEPEPRRPGSPLAPEPVAEQAPLERPSTLGVQQGAAGSVQAAGMPSGGHAQASAQSVAAAGTPSGGAGGRRDSQLTDRGYFDVKYYHNKLW